MQNKLLTICFIALLHAGSSMAQTKIQCQNNQGRMEAPLAWQNTLGAARANAMCQVQGTPQVAPTGATQPSNQTGAAVANKKSFATVDGERASSTLARWGQQEGYRLVWDAPPQADLIMNKGQVDGVSFIDAVSRVVNGLNAKLAEKRRANDADSPWALPIEAFAYSNRVVRIAVKQ
jgi:Tfp pilus assembly protein PilV